MIPSAPTSRTAASNRSPLLDMIDVDEERAPDRAQQLHEHRLALDERATAKVAAVEVEEIEGEVGEHCRIASPHRRREVVEVGDAALVGRSDLAVEHNLAAKFGERPED